jgi:hypothetical protein
MIRNLKNILIIAVILLLTACNKPTESPLDTGQPADTMPVATEASTDLPPTDLPPTDAPNAFEVDPLDPTVVVFDFVDLVCSAAWSTNASYLTCPGHLEEAEGGYIEANDHTVLEGMVSAEAPMLIGLPGNGYPNGLGLFGKYPPFTVYPGDLFKAFIACQGDAVCDLDFSLEYYDQSGSVIPVSWKWDHQAGDGPQEISVDLTPIAGQTVEFFLVLRPHEELNNQWAVWIQPHISRDPAAKPLPTAEILPTPTADPEDKTPGVISGLVDMSSAPPYLKDSMNGGSSPVAVVFFNLSDGTYWWIHTSLTGHPYYQMTVSPGNYQVVAYAQGVGDVPYVAAGYTGQNPSCGKNLKTVTVPPNGMAENIVIADWNWVCGGTASRQPKPAGVPLP